MISEFPLFVFTTFGGLAVGAYVFAALFPVGKEDERRPWLVPLVCLVLLAIGLVGVLGHLGRPALFLNAFANPSAGITQEAYLSCALAVIILADLIASWRIGHGLRALRIVGAVVGIVLSLAMGYAYFVNFGTPAWHAWPTIPLFVIGDLVMGSALYAMLAGGKATRGKTTYTVISVVVDVLFAVSLAFQAVHFQSVGLSAAPFVVALVIAPVACAVLSAVGRKGDKAWVGAALTACAIVGVCIARWFFYAGSVL